MQVQRRHPSFAQPARTGFEVHRVDASTQSQDILQARPADHSNQYYNTSLSPRPGQLNSSGSMSHTDKQQEATTVYHSGSTHLQYMGLTAFGVEKPEKHIQTELEQLYNTLARADRYQKYREKQPALTPAEVIVRDAADKQERESREAEGIPQSHKDGTVWPDFMEYAFWRALVRWPPMGRKKYMLGGVLKGRNELLQDAIYRDTGIIRDRKQISSHLQVLKGLLKGFPIALAYLGTMEDSSKRRHGSIASPPCYSPDSCSPQHAQGMNTITEYGCVGSSHTWPQLNDLHSGVALDVNSHTAYPSYEALSPHENFSSPLSLHNPVSVPLSPNQLSTLAPINTSNCIRRGPTLSSKEEALVISYDNNFGFGCSNISDNGSSQPVFDILAYEGLANQNANLESFQMPSNFDDQTWAESIVLSEEGHLVPMTATTNAHGTTPTTCYPAKPNWQFVNE